MKAAAATKQPSAWDTEVPATLRFRFQTQPNEIKLAPKPQQNILKTLVIPNKNPLIPPHKPPPVA